MEMTIDIDVEPIAEKVVECLDTSDIAREVREYLQYDDRFGELVAEHSGISELEGRVEELEAAVQGLDERLGSDDRLLGSLVKALTSLRDKVKEKEEANRELRKEIRDLKGQG